MEDRQTLSRTREHIRSNVIGYLALFVALSGVAYAAGLPKNSVKSKQIKDAQVRTQDLAPNAVTSDRVADNALTGADIDEGSLQGVAAGGPPSGAAGGDLSGSYPNPQIGAGAIGAAELANGSIDRLGLFAGSLVDGAAASATLRSLGTGAAQAAAGNDPRLSNARPPTGAAGGDLSGNYPNPQLGAGVVGNEEVQQWPHAKVLQTTAQSFANTTTTTVQFDSLSLVSGVTFNFATDSFEIQDTGLYSITGEIDWSSNATGYRVMSIQVNSTEVAATIGPAASANDTVQTATTLARLNAGDAVRMTASQASGGSLSTSVFADRSASLSVNWLGP